MGNWTKDETKKIRAAYLGAHRKLREAGVPKDQRDRIAKDEARAVKEELLSQREK